MRPVPEYLCSWHCVLRVVVLVETALASMLRRTGARRRWRIPRVMTKHNSRDTFTAIPRPVTLNTQCHEHKYSGTGLRLTTHLAEFAVTTLCSASARFLGAEPIDALLRGSTLSNDTKRLFVVRIRPIAVIALYTHVRSHWTDQTRHPRTPYAPQTDPLPMYTRLTHRIYQQLRPCRRATATAPFSAPHAPALQPTATHVHPNWAGEGCLSTSPHESCMPPAARARAGVAS